MNTQDKREYDRHMGKLMYQTYYGVRTSRGMKTLPWSMLNKKSKAVWMEIAARLMSAATTAEEDDVKV